MDHYTKERCKATPVKWNWMTNKSFFIALLILFVPVVGLFSFSHARKMTYIGAERCRECHPKQHAIWEKGRHASSMRSFTNREKEKTACIWCHATDARDLLKNYTLSHVQCEACHGPGSDYAYADVMRDKNYARQNGLVVQSEAVCVQCHTGSGSSTMGKFNYKQASERIRHWN
jgi:hypothetical protein